MSLPLAHSALPAEHPLHLNSFCSGVIWRFSFGGGVSCRIWLCVSRSQVSFEFERSRHTSWEDKLDLQKRSPYFNK